MFISGRRIGHNAAEGLFLVLCQPNGRYCAECGTYGDIVPRCPTVLGAPLPNGGVERRAFHRNHNRRVDFPVRAFVTWTKLTQLGHFMMGSCAPLGFDLTLSGAYGHDGLITDVPWEVYNAATELPNALYNAWSNGGGHNSAGSEATLMRAWALDGVRRRTIAKLGSRRAWIKARKADLASRVENLDGLDPNDLRKWADKAPVRAHPVFKRLARYARTKADAMEHRLAGRVMQAIECENLCDSIYNGLPEWAKW